MAETLTESFCERCGTRYTFEAPKERSGALTGVRVLGKGLRKLALTRASSLDEAITSARADDERESAARQLEAFHGTFHFCLSCRQYTCSECWNDPAGVCLTCEPTPESQAAAALEAALTAEVAAAALRLGDVTEPAPEGPRPDWPAEDRRPGELALEALDATGLEPAADPISEGPAEAPAADGTIDAEPRDEGEVGANPLLRAFQPGTSLDDAIAAYEAAVSSARRLESDDEPAAAVQQEWDGEPQAPVWLAPASWPELEPELEPEPMAGSVAPQPEPELEPELVATAQGSDADDEPAPELVAGAHEPAVDPALQPEPIAVASEPEPIAAASEPEPAPEPAVAASEPEPEPAVAAPASFPIDVAAAQPSAGSQVVSVPPRTADLPLRPAATVEPADAGAAPGPAVDEDPRFAAWRIVAPEIAASAPASPGAVPPFDSEGFAARMSGAAAAVPATGEGRARTATRVQPQAGAHSCISCGLSLSANARFCRRCGTRQG